jgi:hypothetical protein
MSQQDRPQDVGPAQRTCGMCARTLTLHALRPGWSVIEHERRTIWACPDCCRRLKRWAW